MPIFADITGGRLWLNIFLDLIPVLVTCPSFILLKEKNMNYLCEFSLSFTRIAFRLKTVAFTHYGQPGKYPKK